MEISLRIKNLIYRLYNGYTDNQLGMSGMYLDIASELEKCIDEIQKLVDEAKQRSEEWDTISHT